MSTQEKLQQIDARALSLGWTLSQLAREAKVSSATMAKARVCPESVRPRIFSKLEAKLTEKGA